MKKLLLLYLLSVSFSFSFSQYNVKFIVHPPKPYTDHIYIAGSFNKWTPGDSSYLLLPLDGQQSSVTLTLPPGHYEYKFTRGDWSKVETTEAGLDIENRIIDITHDSIVKINIEGWLDDFKDVSSLPDSIRWRVAYSRSFFYLEKNLDSSYKYAQLANALLPKLNDKKYEAAVARILGKVIQRQGNHQRALEYYLKQLSLLQELKDTLSISFCLLDIGHLFLGIKDYAKAKSYYLKVAEFDPIKTSVFGNNAPNLALVKIGRIHYDLREPDSAKWYASQAYNLSLKTIDRRSQSEALTLLGNIVADEGKISEATNYYRLAIEQAKIYNSSSAIAENYQYIANAFYRNNQVDSSLYYARETLALAEEINSPFAIADASNLLATLFKKKGQADSAFRYLENVLAAKDILFSQNRNQQLQTILFNEELQKQESKANNDKFKTQVKLYMMAAGIILLLWLCIFLLVNNRRKHQINKLLNERGEKIKKTLAELELTQTQLVQKEKMASLGELTAGIAHEIQNPLNFINNFSEVSVDIAKELKEELATINVASHEQMNLKSIVEELIQNQQKIIEHGHRADAIVKGMLQHSRNTAGEREPININILTEEFLRLSYYGLKAKDKSFSATYKTDFDNSIGKIIVVPQNIGRVLLNLFNNAFYSVAEKKKKLNGNFEPTVWVSTKRLNGQIEICVRDNGLGIPENVVSKIFQPFYTTKPTGHGTGLGLSLSYDIITKEHGGMLSAETKEGEFALFKLVLPEVMEKKR
jgi:signal transduction histidine kinase